MPTRTLSTTSFLLTLACIGLPSHAGAAAATAPSPAPAPAGTWLKLPAWLAPQATGPVAPRLLLRLATDWDDADGMAVSSDGTLMAFATSTGFEVLDAKTGQAIATADLGSIVTSLLFGRDDDQLIAGCKDGKVRIWSRQAQALTATLAHGETSIVPMALDAEGVHLATASADAGTKIWELPAGRLVRTLTKPGDKIGDRVRALTFGPGRDTLTIARYRQPVKMLDVNTGDVRLTLAADAAHCAAMNPAGTILATGHRDGSVKLWNMPGGSPLRTLAGTGDEVYAVAFSPSGQRVIAGGDDERLRLWDVATGDLLHTVAAARNDIWHLSYSPDGRRILAAGIKQEALIFDTGESVATRPPGWPSSMGYEASPPGAPEPAVASVRVVEASPATEASTATGSQAPSGLWRGFTRTGGHVFTLAYSKDGTRVAVGGKDPYVHVVDARTGKEIRRFDAPDGFATQLAFHPSGDWLAAASDEGSLRVWRVDTGAVPLNLPRQKDRTLWSTCFSPDGTLLAGGDALGAVHLWDVASWKLKASRPGSEIAVMDLDFSPDGSHLAVSHQEGLVEILRTKGLELESRLQGHRATVNAVAYSPDGRWLATGGMDGLVGLWAGSDGTWSRWLRGDTLSVRDVAFTPDGGRLLSAGLDGDVVAWDPSSGAATRRWALPQGQALHAIACAPSTSVVLAGGHESLVLALDVGQEAAEAVPFRQEAPTRRLRLPGGAGAAARVAWAPDGTWLAWAGADAAAPISLLNPATGQVMRAWEGLRQRFHDLAVSPDGRHVTGASASGKLHTWDARTGKPVSTLNAHQGAAVAVASSPDGRWLASGGIDGQVGVWQRSNGERRWRLAHPKAVNAVAFSPDGAWLASACDDNRVRLWSVASGQLARTLEGHTDWVTRLAFSPDGRWLASGGDDRNVRLWPLSPEGSPQLLSGHDGAISDLAFLRDGRHLVSIGGKQGALVWHLASGMVAQSLARTGEDGRLGLSPDGRTLVMTDASKEGGLAVWDVGDERRSEP